MLKTGQAQTLVMLSKVWFDWRGGSSAQCRRSRLVALTTAAGVRQALDMDTLLLNTDVMSVKYRHLMRRDVQLEELQTA